MSGKMLATGEKKPSFSRPVQSPISPVGCRLRPEGYRVSGWVPEQLMVDGAEEGKQR